MVTTRFAPGISGDLHIGGLANALLNWLTARRDGGKFLVRMDGGNMGAYCQGFRNRILRDLAAFGLEPDNVWDFAPRQAEIIDEFRQWVINCPQAYACFCTPEEVAERHSPDLARIDRPEKYPPLAYAVEAVYGEMADGRIVWPQHATASSTARGEFIVGPKPREPVEWSAANVLNESPLAWRPWSVGFQGPYLPPWLRVEFHEPSDFSNLCVLFPTGVPRLTQLVWFGSEGEMTTEIRRPQSISTEEHWDQAGELVRLEAPSGCGTIVSVRMDFIEAPPWYMRPYHYDRHCARIERNYSQKALEEAMVNPKRGVVRLECAGMHPTAVWFSGTPDLAWYSPFIDRQLGVNHIWRGRDLIPFGILEATTASSIGYMAQRWYHPLVLDPLGVKYSKHQNAPRIAEQGDTRKTIGTLAFLLGLAPNAECRDPQELLGSAIPNKEDVLWPAQPDMGANST